MIINYDDIYEQIRLDFITAYQHKQQIADLQQQIDALQLTLNELLYQPITSSTDLKNVIELPSPLAGEIANKQLEMSVLIGDAKQHLNSMVEYVKQYGLIRGDKSQKFHFQHNQNVYECRLDQSNKNQWTIVIETV